MSVKLKEDPMVIRLKGTMQLSCYKGSCGCQDKEGPMAVSLKGTM